MKTGQKGLDIIKKYEGLRLQAYLCPAGVWTIGHGHTSNVTPDDEINEAQAEDLLKSDIAPIEKYLTLSVNQNQFDALVSLIFNIGIGNFESSTLYRLAKNNVNDIDIPAQFLRWNKARVNGILTELPGLTKRRKEESELYKSK